MEWSVAETPDVALGRKLLVVSHKDQLFKGWKCAESRRNVGLPRLGGLLDQKNTGFRCREEPSIFRQACGRAADDVDAMFADYLKVASPFVYFLLLCLIHSVAKNSMESVLRRITKPSLENLVDATTEG